MRSEGFETPSVRMQGTLGCYRVFRKLRTRPQDNPNSHFCIQVNEDPISDASAQGDLFMEAYSEGAHNERLPVEL